MVDITDSVSSSELLAFLRAAHPELKASLGKVLEAKQKDCEYLVKEIECVGGHSLINLIRGNGVPYSEVVHDVAKQLKVKNLAPKRNYIENEKKILDALYQSFITKMTEEELLSLEKSFSILADEHDKDYKAIAGTGGAMALGAAGGFSTYLAATTVLGGLTSAVGVTIPFVAYTTMTSAISVALGPIGWLALGGFAIYKVGSPNMKKTIHAVGIIAAYRQTKEFEESHR